MLCIYQADVMTCYALIVHLWVLVCLDWRVTVLDGTVMTCPNSWQQERGFLKCHLTGGCASVSMGQEENLTLTSVCALRCWNIVPQWSNSGLALRGQVPMVYLWLAHVTFIVGLVNLHLWAGGQSCWFTLAASVIWKPEWLVYHEKGSRLEAWVSDVEPMV